MVCVALEALKPTNFKREQAIFITIVIIIIILYRIITFDVPPPQSTKETSVSSASRNYRQTKKMKPRKRYIEIVKGEIINFRVTNTLKSRKCVRVLQQLNPFFVLFRSQQITARKLAKKHRQQPIRFTLTTDTCYYSRKWHIWMHLLTPNKHQLNDSLILCFCSSQMPVFTCLSSKSVCFSSLVVSVLLQMVSHLLSIKSSKCRVKRG